MAMINLVNIFSKLKNKPENTQNAESYKKKCNLVTVDLKNVTAQHIENTVKNDVGYKVTKVTLKKHKTGKWVLNRQGWQEYFEERAGILEFDGGLNRYDSEVQAFNETIYKFCEVNDYYDTDFAVNALIALGLKNPYRKKQYQ